MKKKMANNPDLRPNHEAFGGMVGFSMIKARSVMANPQRRRDQLAAAHRQEQKSQDFQKVMFDYYTCVVDLFYLHFTFLIG